MIKAILWDFDGTLANSNEKNYLVTLELFKNEAPHILESKPFNLSSREEFDKALVRYEDWRELYKDCYNLSNEETERLGSLWAKYQVDSNIETSLFMGIPEIVKHYLNVKQAVISQNGIQNIKNVLSNNNILNCFDTFIGIDEYPGELAKPNHTSFVDCLKSLNVAPDSGKIIYIGDHEVDTNFVRTTQDYFKSKNIDSDLYAIATSYGGSFPETWNLQPDFIAKTTNELYEILKKLNGE